MRCRRRYEIFLCATRLFITQKKYYCDNNQWMHKTEKKEQKTGINSKEAPKLPLLYTYTQYIVSTVKRGVEVQLPLHKEVQQVLNPLAEISEYSMVKHSANSYDSMKRKKGGIKGVSQFRANRQQAVMQMEAFIPVSQANHLQICFYCCTVFTYF